MKKTVWVFLRGLIRESGHWGDFPQKFQKKFPNDLILTIDLPGNGGQNHRESPTKMSEYARYAHTELQKALFDLENKGPYEINLFAISLGAMVAVEWNRLYPGIFKHAVLMNTSLKGLSPVTKRLRPRNYPRILNMLLNPLAKLEEIKILEMVSNVKENQEKTAPYWESIKAERPVSKKNCMRQLKAALTFRPDISSLNLPILLLGSKQDRLVSFQCTLDLHNVLDSDLEVHPTAGHDLALDDSEWVLDKVASWMEKRRSSSKSESSKSPRDRASLQI